MFLFGLPNISKMASERDFDGLVRCLEHRDPLVRLQAAQALTRLNDGRGWRYLLDAVRQSEDDKSQAAAAEMLGELGHTRAVPVLQAALPAARGDALEAIREALQALGVDQEQPHTSPSLPAERELEWQPEGQSVFSALFGKSTEGEAPDAETAQPVLHCMEVEFHSAEQHLNNAVQLRESELQERALVECALALWLSPKWEYAWYLRGVLFEDLEREREALLAYRRSLELDGSRVEAREAYADLNEALGPLPENIENILEELVSGDWRERRDGAAWMGEWLLVQGGKRAQNYAAGAEALLEALLDPEREVRHAAIEALGRLGETRFAAKTPTLVESSWLLRFATIQALSDIGVVHELAARIGQEMDGFQERNPIFTSQRDPFLELEYDLILEIGALALERTGNLEGLLDLAEGNTWEEIDQEADEEFGPDKFADDEELDEDLLSYVDETSLMAAVALERLALRTLSTLSPALLKRLSLVPDLTLLDLEGQVEHPVIVHDFSELRRQAVKVLQSG